MVPEKYSLSHIYNSPEIEICEVPTVSQLRQGEFDWGFFWH